MSKCCIFCHDDLWWNLDEILSQMEQNRFLNLSTVICLILSRLSEWELFSFKPEMFCSGARLKLVQYSEIGH